MSEGGHIDCQVSPQIPSTGHHRCPRGLCAGPLPGHGGDVLPTVAGAVSTRLHPSYSEDDEWEAAFVLRERSRPGCGDLKWKALVRDGFHCRGCAVVVTSKTSHADHIVPVNRFANLEMANSLDNIQTLCLRCHKLKHARETMSTESSGKPDAWKLARPVWGWGRGVTPRPTPHLGDEDKRANDQALVDGSRLLSAYRTLKGERIWIITEAADDQGQRAATTAILPSEY